MILSMKLISFNFLNKCTRILTKRKVIDVMDIIDKNLTIDRSTPKLINVSDKKSTFVAK